MSDSRARLAGAFLGAKVGGADTGRALGISIVVVYWKQIIVGVTIAMIAGSLMPKVQSSTPADSAVPVAPVTASVPPPSGPNPTVQTISPTVPDADSASVKPTTPTVQSDASGQTGAQPSENLQAPLPAASETAREGLDAKGFAPIPTLAAPAPASARAQELTARPPAIRPDVSACLQSYMDVGHLISRASWLIATHEISRGGELTFQQSTNIQNQIYSASLHDREAIRAIEGTGDVVQCHTLRDKADQTVMGVLRASQVAIPVNF